MIPLWAFSNSWMTGYKNDLMKSKKRTRTTRKTDLILFYLEIYFLLLVQVGFLPPSTAFLCQAAKFKTLNRKVHFSDNELCHVVSPCSYAVFQWRHKISVLVFWAFFCCIFIKRKMKLLKGSVHTYPNIFETIFFSVLSLLPSTIKRLFQAPKMYVL